MLRNWGIECALESFGQVGTQKLIHQGCTRILWSCRFTEIEGLRVHYNILVKLGALVEPIELVCTHKLMIKTPGRISLEVQNFNFFFERTHFGPSKNQSQIQLAMCPSSKLRNFMEQKFRMDRPLYIHNCTTLLLSFSLLFYQVSSTILPQSKALGNNDVHIVW